MIKFETLKALVDIYKKCEAKCNKVSSGFENLFEDDSNVMFYWPSEFCGKQIKSVLISEFGQSSDEADWFIYEAIPSFESNFCSEVYEEREGKMYSYKIHNLKDYYNYITKDFEKLESEEITKEKLEEKNRRLHMGDCFLEDMRKFFENQ